MFRAILIRWISHPPRAKGKLGMQILVVEDNPSNLRLVRDLLELRGHTVLEATDGEQAVEMARLHRPQLILMDIRLPILDGVSAVKQIREHRRTQEIPVVAITASAMKGDEQRFLDQGFDGYIAKPIDTRSFCDTVEQYGRDIDPEDQLPF